MWRFRKYINVKKKKKKKHIWMNMQMYIYSHSAQRHTLHIHTFPRYQICLLISTGNWNHSSTLQPSICALPYFLYDSILTSVVLLFRLNERDENNSGEGEKKMQNKCPSSNAKKTQMNAGIAAVAPAMTWKTFECNWRSIWSSGTKAWATKKIGDKGIYPCLRVSIAAM